MKVVPIPEKASPEDVLEFAKSEKFSDVVVIGITADAITTLSTMTDPQAHWVISQAQFCLVRSELDGNG